MFLIYKTSYSDSSVRYYCTYTPQPQNQIVTAHFLCKMHMMASGWTLNGPFEAQSRFKPTALSATTASLCKYKGTCCVLCHHQVALHACGVATDMVLDRCLRARAGFVVSPCCYGFIQNTLKFNFPKR